MHVSYNEWILVQYMKIPNLNMGRTCCVQKSFLTFRTIFVHNMFSSCSAKRRTSDKDLPVLKMFLKTITDYWAKHKELCVADNLQH